MQIVLTQIRLLMMEQSDQDLQFTIPLNIIRYNYEKQILIPKVRDKVFKILEHLS